nr:DUF4132 domain-containing protein [Paraflavitalea speifideiaquila]
MGSKLYPAPADGNPGQKLIWHFDTEGAKQQGIWWNGGLVDVQGEPLTGLTVNTSVQLWHPIGFGPDVIVAWRDFLLHNEITQPFKQAYREVYLVTDAELNTETYSNRFAAHVLRQQQFAALCKQRGWSYAVMGNWDSHNTPELQIPGWKMMAQYYVDANWEGDMTSSGIFQHILTDQVRFYREGEQLKMQDVPAIVFTEVMRDVDLLLG